MKAYLLQSLICNTKTKRWGDVIQKQICRLWCFDLCQMDIFLHMSRQIWFKCIVHWVVYTYICIYVYVWYMFGVLYMLRQICLKQKVQNTSICCWFCLFKRFHVCEYKFDLSWTYLMYPISMKYWWHWGIWGWMYFTSEQPHHFSSKLRLLKVFVNLI